MLTPDILEADLTTLRPAEQLECRSLALPAFGTVTGTYRPGS